MEWRETVVTLKDGTSCEIGSAAPQDAPLLLEHLRATAGETVYMVRYPDEVTLTVVDEEAYITRILENPRAVLLTAKVGGTLVAMAGVNPIGEPDKVRHRGSFGISIRESHWKLGIGTALLQEVLEAAKALGYSQLELEVVSENWRAIALYQKLGFIRYGARPAGFRLRDGRKLEELLMLRSL